MHELILWAGFLGGWLLVAGPVFQAGVELREEQFERERLVPIVDQVGPPPVVSPWWWLVPPLRLYVGRRRGERWKRELLLALPDEDYAALTSYMRKARGWMLVAGGAALIAVKETYELVEGHHWALWVFWVLVPVMAFGSVAHAVVQGVIEQRAAEERRGHAAARPVPHLGDNGPHQPS